jgi:DnaJ-domain-containing protein 1
VPRIALTEDDGFLMSRADGSLNLSEIVSVSPLPEEDTLKALHGLVAAGILAGDGAETAPVRVPTLSALDAFLKRTSGGEAVRAASTPSPAAASGRSSGEPSRAPEAVAAHSPGIDEDRTEVLARIQECNGVDYYRVLGVEKAADEGKVRRAYYKLAKHFHPDRYHKPGFEDILPDIERMFAQTTEAYNTLTEERSRAEYDRHLAELASGAKSPEVDRVHAAREHYVRAKKHLEADELFDALRLFETACEMDPSRHEYFLYLGIVQTRNPKWRKKAEQCFLQAIEMSPSSTQAYLHLARLYKAGGLARKSAEMYEKLLAWEPDNQEALVELGRAKPAVADTGKRRSLFKGSKS